MGEGSGKVSGGRSGIDVVCNAGAGAASGAMAATFVCPLDVIKTRFQVYGIPAGQRGNVIVTTLQQIVKADGFRGLYRGLSPTLIALLPNWAVYFSVYPLLKNLIHPPGNTESEIGIGANMIVAAGAGAATAISTNPLWVVKTRLQTQGMRPDVVPYKSIVSAFQRIVHEEGVRGLYSGLLPSLAGISHVAIQFPLYERTKSYLARRDNTTVDKLSPPNIAIASSGSKVVASLMTYPHEVVRSSLQEQGQHRDCKPQYSGVIDCTKKIYLNEGLRGFYRGCGTNLLRTTPSSVITFTSYEMIKRFLHSILSPENLPQAYRAESASIAKALRPSQDKTVTTTSIGNTNVAEAAAAQSQSCSRTPSITLRNKDKLTSAP